MLWTVAVFLLLVFRLDAAPAMSEAAAREKLKQGALLIDVRTVAEFNAKHLTNAVNLPLNELKAGLSARVPDKSRVLLLHCRSGQRSRIATGELRALGYTNAFNLGSYQQAEKIVAGPGQAPSTQPTKP